MKTGFCKKQQSNSRIREMYVYDRPVGGLLRGAKEKQSLRRSPDFVTAQPRSRGEGQNFRLYRDHFSLRVQPTLPYRYNLPSLLLGSLIVSGRR